MPNYTYTRDIPAANNDPGVDQPIMTINSNSTDSILDVDLYGFNDNNGGTHQQVTFPLNVTPSVPTGLAAVAYTQPGTASPSTSQLWVQNSNTTIIPTTLRAWALCNSSGVVGTQSMNVTSVTRSAAGQYLVTLVTNTTSSTNFAVVVSPNMGNNFTSGSIGGYTITGTGTFQLNFRALTGAFGVDPSSFSFSVYQI